eukprot:scaffold9274_cov103-Isochrysis_galbana.AAC.6
MRQRRVLTGEQRRARRAPPRHKDVLQRRAQPAHCRVDGGVGHLLNVACVQEQRLRMSRNTHSTRVESAALSAASARPVPSHGASRSVRTCRRTVLRGGPHNLADELAARAGPLEGGDGDDVL